MSFGAPRSSWTTAFLIFAALSLSAAWFNVQAVRWGYRNQRLRSQLDGLTKRRQSLDRRLQESLSLDRLDRAARGTFHLNVPAPDQIVLLPEAEEKPG
jgi:type II secretory pathway component PulJ